jgi:hypothetical protein
VDEEEEEEKNVGEAKREKRRESGHMYICSSLKRINFTNAKRGE